MPLKRCSESGKSGWKWGNSGKCYVGKGGKKKAIKQGIAIEGPDKFKEEVSKAGLNNDSDVLEVIDEMVTKQIEDNLNND